jgi:hypothetical protein
MRKVFRLFLENVRIPDSFRRAFEFVLNPNVRWRHPRISGQPLRSSLLAVQKNRAGFTLPG